MIVFFILLVLCVSIIVISLFTSFDRSSDETYWMQKDFEKFLKYLETKK